MGQTDPCRIGKNSTKAKILMEADLLILDEVTMMDKFDLERIDRLLKDLMGEKELPFGGKNVILTGDFR